MIECARLRRDSVSPSILPKRDGDQRQAWSHAKLVCVAVLPNARALSASIGAYRARADLFDGTSDSKSVVRLGKGQHFQALIGAEDN